MGRGKGQYYQVCTDKVKVPRTVEKHYHILIEDPQKTDNDSSDSITESPQAKRILRSQVDVSDKNKCAIFQKTNNVYEEQRSKIKRTFKFKQDSHRECFTTKGRRDSRLQRLSLLKQG